MNDNVLVTGLMTFKFEGQKRIDAHLLATSLEGLAQAYEAFLDVEYEGHDSGIEINVRAFAPGSFEVLVESIVPVFPAIAPHVPTALECGKAFLELVKIKRELKGKKAKEVESSDTQAKIINHEGEVHYYNCNVYNTYINNPTIDAGLSKLFSSLNNSERPAVSFMSGNQSVRIDHESYGEMSAQVVDEFDSQSYQTLSSIVQEQLLLKSPDLLGDSRWDFYYRGKTIHVSIEDKKFIDDVKSGRIKQLYAGVRIPVEMKIEAFFNEKLEAERTVYTVLKVTGSIIEPPSNSNQLMIKDIEE